MACAWIRVSENCAINPSRASGRVLRRPDQPDHLVEVIERDLQPFEDVRARFRLAQLELGPPPDHFAPELDEVLDDVEQREDLRPASDDREHDDPERRLQLRVLVQIVQHDVGHLAPAELDHDPHAVAVRLVPQIGDALDHLLAHQLGDLLDQPRLVDLVGNLGDDDRDAIAFLALLGRRLGAQA